MNKTTRNEIRRASQDQLRCRWSRDLLGEAIEEFCRFVSRHGGGKPRTSEARAWLTAHARCGTLDLSCVEDAAGTALAWHAYYRDEKHARLRFSVCASKGMPESLRARIGRANRYLHWQDMRRFKAEKILIYDLGGWYSGSDDEKLLNINRFKEALGGSVTRSFHCTFALTRTGRLYLKAYEWRKRLRSVLSPEFRRRVRTLFSLRRQDHAT